MPDDRLRLMFTCCHPALSLEARVALTLRTLAGLTTAEIARAFLASEPTMAKRLVRAKQKIQHAGIPYRVPPAHLLPERTPGVLGVLYLLFNEGYSATAGADLVRQNLSAEAIRLARVLVRLMPDEPETAGLLALMLLHDARRSARLDAAGDLVTLEDQDRSSVGRRGDRRGRRCSGGGAAARAAGSLSDPGGHRGLPRDRARADGTDWPQIAALYGELAAFLPTPVVELNHAVAVGMARGPAAGLAAGRGAGGVGQAGRLSPAPRDQGRLPAPPRPPAEAAAAYREALELTSTDAERRYLSRRLAETSGQA